jgi:hypothetical protein
MMKIAELKEKLIELKMLDEYLLDGTIDYDRHILLRDSDTNTWIFFYCDERGGQYFKSPESTGFVPYLSFPNEDAACDYIYKYAKELYEDRKIWAKQAEENSFANPKRLKI